MKAVLQWVLRTMMKDQTGIVRTMPKKDLVDFNVAMTAERLMRNGVDPNALKNANQVENAINQIEAPRKQKTIGEARGIKSAKIMDMEGKEIDPRSKIMGGKQSETEAEIAERLSRENKESAARIKNKKIVKDAIDNVSPGFVKGDRKYNAQLVAEDLADKKFGKEFYDLDQRQQMDLYDEALDGLSVDLDDFAQGGRAGFVAGGITNLAMRLARGFMKVTGRKPNDEEFMKIIREAAERDFAEVSDDVALRGVSETRATARRMDDIDKDELKKAIDEYKIPVRTQEEFDFAQGGRAGFKIGGINKARRAFLKTVGATGAGITALKTGLLGLSKEAAPAVEAVKETVTQAPSYFFDLAAKIKTLGRMSDGPSERIKEYSMKGKDGKSELLLTEDISTGEMQIKKIGKEGDDMVTDVQTMEYTPGSSLADETTRGIPADQYDEYTEFQSRIYKDEFNDPDIVDGINVEDIIKEVKDQAPPIKKAGGGIARMLGE